MPNILPLEVVVVGAGIVVLWLAPAFISWADSLRRRRSERLLPLAAATGSTWPPPTVPQPADAVPQADEAAGSSPPPAAAAVVAAAEAMESTAAAVPESPAPGASTPLAQPPVAEMAATRHQFRLQDLRRARILDWPPAEVRNDPERYRRWQEGQRAAAVQQARMDTVQLSAAFAPQSVCFAGTEAAGSILRVRYLLFPDLWPVAENQASAEAVFQIDGEGEIEAWTAPRQPPSDSMSAVL